MIVVIMKKLLYNISLIIALFFIGTIDVKAYDLIDSTSVVVYNHNDLKTVLEENNGITHVYLGEDITLTSGIAILPTKTEVTIDGVYNGITHTLTDMKRSAAVDTIHIIASSSIKITLQNINVVGNNMYGIVCIYDGYNTDNVVVAIDNVTYNGPQMLYHRFGLVRITNSTINIITSYTGPQEVAEAKKIELGGIVTINHTATANAAFFLNITGTAIDVLANANITITTKKAFAYTYPFPTPITIHENAKLQVTNDQGFLWDGAHEFSDFHIMSGADVKIIQTKIFGTNPSLTVRNSLTIDEKASFYMESNYTSADPLIKFSTSSASLNINNPKSVFLYNSTSSIFNFLYTTKFNITSGQINYWETPFPIINLLPTPLYMWHKQDGTSLNIGGSATSILTAISTNNLTAQEILSLPSLLLFRLQSAKTLSIGDIPLDVSPVTSDDLSITGVTLPNATIEIKYNSTTLTAAADAFGVFTVQLGSKIPVDTSVTITAGLHSLTTKVTLTVSDEGEIRFSNVPTSISFGAVPLPNRKTIIKRLLTDWTLSIYDSRTKSTDWKLYATINGPMKTDDAHTLTNSLLFIDDETHILSSSPTLIHSEPANVGPPKTTNVSWEEEKGLLMDVDPSEIVTNKEYRTTITWTIVNAP